MEPIGNAPQGLNRSNCYRFGDVVVDAIAHTVHRDGQPQSLEPKAFDVLLCLLRHAGELVHHADLLDAVWGHRHVTPGVLTRAIAQIRHALGDDPQHPRCIQTQHGLGYRFIGELLPEPAAIQPFVAQANTAPGAAQPGVASHDKERRSGDIGGLARKHVAATSLVPAPTVEQQSIAVSALPLESLVPPRPRARGKWLLLAAAVVAALLAWAWLRPGNDISGVPPSRASVLIMPFASLGSANAQDEYFAKGLAIEMHDALADIPGLRVAAFPLEGRQRDMDPRSLGKLMDVTTVLDASVRRNGNRVRISARLIEPSSGFTLWSHTYDREVGDVFTVQSEIAESTAAALLGVLPEGRPSLVRRLAPTHDPNAYDLYLRGLHLLEQTGRAEPRQAIAWFQKALDSDKSFARAQAGICRAQILLFERGRDADAFTRARAACLQAEKMDPTLREISLALGDMHRVRGEFAMATEHYTRALEDPSLRPDAYIGLSRVEGAQRKGGVALDYLVRAHDLRPGDARIQRELGFRHYQNGNLAAAIDAFRIATRLDPDDAVGWSSLGGVYLLNGDTQSAAHAFQRSLDIRPSYNALTNLGVLHYEEGRYLEAVAAFRKAAKLSPEDFRVHGNMADALAAQPGSGTEARSHYERAATMATRYLAIGNDDPQAMALLAWYQANLGEAEAARRWLAKAEALKSEEAEVALLGAQTFARLGYGDAARARLARARSLQVPERRIRASPVLRDLEGSNAARAPTARG